MAMSAVPKGRDYRAFARLTDPAPRIAHGRTDDKAEKIRRPFGAVPRKVGDWQ